MKIFFGPLIFSLFFMLSLHAASNPIIPKPFYYQSLHGSFDLSLNSSYLNTSPLSANALVYLEAHLSGTLKKVQQKQSASLFFLYKKEMRSESYTLRVTDKQITIEASDSAGFFYATVSLMQLMEAKVWSTDIQKIETWRIPAVYIEDHPQYPWRGMMLDTARTFYSVAYVKKFIDRMAQMKLNRFHWHLSDDEGWRIEIKRYPLLTQVGSSRGPGTLLPFSTFPTMKGPKNRIEKGYYTQEEIKEIVAYASLRSIEILPEIDLPAHSKAAVVSYPHLLQDPQDTGHYTSIQKVSNNTIDAGLESSYLFIDNVIKELTSLFPFEYIHLGGDEIPKGAWRASPAVQKLMKVQGLKDRRAVQGYFFTRLDAILKKHRRALVAWQEILKYGATLRDKSIVMSWRDNGAERKALNRGKKVVASSAKYLYLDQQYVKSSNEPGHTWAGPTDTKELYSYKVPLKKVSKRYQKNFLGIHGCLWSERAPSEAIADYLSWPRLFALSELAWSGTQKKDWNHLKQRILHHGLKQLNAQHVHYRVPNATF